MTDFLGIMFSNAVLMIPLAVIVAIIARWLNRPAAVHCLWVIVLLKLISPQFYLLPVPGIAETTSQIFAPIQNALRLWPDPQFEVSDQPTRAQESSELLRNVQLQSEPRVASAAATNLSLTASQFAASGASEVRQSLVSNHSADSYPAIAVASSRVSPSIFSVRRCLVIAWGIGTLVFCCTLLYRARRFHGFVTRAPLAPMRTQSIAQSIARKYQLRTAPTIRVATGDFPPLLWVLPGSASIVLPRKFLSELDTSGVRNLLAHELAHYARGDHWIRLLESIVLAVYWWHPLAWWARRQLQHAEEQCCDAWVLWAYPKSKTEYARTLLATLDYLSGARSALPPLASGLGRTNLVQRRFEMILHHKSPRKLSSTGFALAVTTALVVLPWSTSFVAQAQDTATGQADVVVAEQVKDSPGDRATVKQRVKKEMQRAQKQKIKREKALKRTEQRKARKQKNSKNVEVEITDVNTEISDLESQDIHRMVQSAIERGLQHAHESLQHVHPHVSRELPAHIAESLEELANSDWLHSLTESLASFEGVSEEELEAIAEHIESAMEHVGEAVEKSAEAFGRAVESEMEAIEAKLESMEDLDLTRDTESIPVHQGSRQTMSHVMRAVQKAGLSAVDAQKVAQSVEEALAAFDAQFAEADVEVQVHTDVIADAVIPAPTAPVAPRLPAVEAKQPKQPRQPKAISKAKRPKRPKQPKPQATKRSKQRDQKVEDILRQIKSLVKQLEQVEADADATSTLR